MQFWKVKRNTGTFFFFWGGGVSNFLNMESVHHGKKVSEFLANSLPSSGDDKFIFPESKIIHTQITITLALTETCERCYENTVGFETIWCTSWDSWVSQAHASLAIQIY